MRPMARAGCIFFISLAVASLFCAQYQFLISCCLLAAAAFFILLVKTKRMAGAALLVAAVAFGYMGLFTQFVYQPSQLYDGKTVQVSGRITDIVQEGSKIFYNLNLDQIGEKPVRFSFGAQLTSFTELNAGYGDRITALAKLSSTALGEKLTIYEKARSKDIFLGGYLVDGQDIRIDKARGISPQAFCLNLRDRLAESLDRNVNFPQNWLLKGVLFGRYQGMDDATVLNFRRAGTAHILAVSGLHLTILSQTVLLFLLLLRVPKRVARGIAILFILLYVMIAGLTPSVVRAGIMTIIYLSAGFFKRESDGLNSLGAAAVIILAVSPYAVMNISFLLSFSATLGILTLAPKLVSRCQNSGRIPPKLKEIAGNFCVGLSAWLFTLPVSIFVFSEISLVAPLTNIVVAPFISPLLVLGMLTGIAGAVPFFGGVAELLDRAASAVAWSVSKIVEFFAGIPYANLPIGFEYFEIWVCAAVLLFAVALLLFNRRRAIRITALLSAILLLSGRFSYEVFNKNVITLTVLGNYNGYSLVVSYDGRATVIECGGSGAGLRAVSYLSSKGITIIDSLIFTGADKSRAQGASLLINQIDTLRSVVLPSEGALRDEVEKTVQEKGVQLQPLGTMQLLPQKYFAIEVDDRFETPVLLLRFPHVTLAYSPASESLLQGVENKNVNILLTNGEINSSFKNSQDRYAIILDDNNNHCDPVQRDHSLGVCIDHTTEIKIGMDGKLVVRRE